EGFRDEPGQGAYRGGVHVSSPGRRSDKVVVRRMSARQSRGLPPGGASPVALASPEIETQMLRKLPPTAVRKGRSPSPRLAGSDRRSPERRRSARGRDAVIPVRQHARTASRRSGSPRDNWGAPTAPSSRAPLRARKPPYRAVSGSARERTARPGWEGIVVVTTFAKHPAARR